MSSWNSILILKLGGIGDIVTSTPALRALRKSFPQAHITLCGESVPSELIRRAGLVDDFICFDDLGRCQNYLQFLAGPMRRRGAEFVKRLRSRRYDLYLDFHDLYYFSSIFKPWFVGLASGAPTKIGLDTDGKGFFLDRRVPTTTYGFEHMIDRCLRVVEAAGAKSDGRQTQIGLSDRDRDFAAEFMKANGAKEGERLFCVHPGANADFPLKFWPVDKFIEVALWLTTTYQVRILLVGAKTDRPLISKMKEALGTKGVLAPENTSVCEFGALLERCGFYLGADTGPLHMAIALRVPAVGIFGPGNYPAYGFYGVGYEFFSPIWHQIPEWPWTRSTKVLGNPYMDAVTVEEVKRECQAQIKKFVSGVSV